MPRIPIVSQARVLPLARIRRERMTESRCQVLVAMGARIGALDVVTRAETGGRLRPVPLARYLRVSESSLSKYVLKSPGDTLVAREIIASKSELFGTLRRIYRAPGAGRVSALFGSWLALDLMDSPAELKALYRGTVVNVVPHLGVEIEAVGAIVQGVWGGGGEGYGVLKSIVDSPGAVLTGDKIDVVSRGAILIAGAGVTEEAVRRAAQERVAGLIVGGLAPDLRSLVAELAVPTLVTDALGECPMSKQIFELLVSHNGDETSISTSSLRRSALRPEVFIPVMVTGGSANASAPPTLAADVGARVRIVAGPGAGNIGKIADVPAQPRLMESGITAWGAEVIMPADSRVFLPWENLELVD
ncbi:MAG: hypothetical protein M1482_01415 [Chloroflexi bacterium]|nr:hypothetical protein [Chloroflexota bacterium]